MELVIPSWAQPNGVQSPPFPTGWIRYDPVLRGGFLQIPEGGADPYRAQIQSWAPLLTSSFYNTRVRPLSLSPSETQRLPSPTSRPEVVPPLSASLGGLRPSLSALPPLPAPHSLYPTPYSLFLNPCSLISPSPILFPHKIPYPHSLYPPSCYHCTVPPVFLNPSLHPLFSLNFHLPSVFFPSLSYSPSVHLSISPVLGSTPPLPPLVSAPQSIRPATLLVVFAAYIPLWAAYPLAAPVQ